VAVKRQIKDKQKRKAVSEERLHLQNLRIKKKKGDRKDRYSIFKLFFL
jgi:hypothetical protein